MRRVPAVIQPDQSGRCLRRAKAPSSQSLTPRTQAERLLGRQPQKEAFGVAVLAMQRCYEMEGRCSFLGRRDAPPCAVPEASVLLGAFLHRALSPSRLLNVSKTVLLPYPPQSHAAGLFF